MKTTATCYIETAKKYVTKHFFFFYGSKINISNQ